LYKKRDQSLQAITLEHDWSLFAPLEAVQLSFIQSLSECPFRGFFVDLFLILYKF